jgi:transposase
MVTIDASLLLERLDKIEAALQILTAQHHREWYSVEEIARILGKAEFTVREWCRHGRINAEKRMSGRGAFPAWVVSHQELLRYQREGLMPAARSA